MRGDHDMVAPLVGLLEAVEDLPGAGFACLGLAGEGGKCCAKQKAYGPHRESLLAGSDRG
jgi:hypothetical protein